MKRSRKLCSGAPLHVHQMSKPLVNTLFVLLLCIWLLVAVIKFVGWIYIKFRKEVHKPSCQHWQIVIENSSFHLLLFTVVECKQSVCISSDVHHASSNNWHVHYQIQWPIACVNRFSWLDEIKLKTKRQNTDRKSWLTHGIECHGHLSVLGAGPCTVTHCCGCWCIV